MFSTTTNTVTITPQQNTSVSIGSTSTPITVTQGSTSVVKVNALGPQGVVGPTGPAGELTSYTDLTVTGSLYVSGTLGGHITASGNISASGDIYGDVYWSNGTRYLTKNAGGIFMGTVTQKIEIDGTAIILDAPVTASIISASANIYTSDYFDDGANINTIYSPIDSPTFTGNITSSGNISASGNIIANEITASSLDITTATVTDVLRIDSTQESYIAGEFSFKPTQNGFRANTLGRGGTSRFPISNPNIASQDFVIGTNNTANYFIFKQTGLLLVSGSDTRAGDIEAAGNITASGNITSSGTISGINAQFSNIKSSGLSQTRVTFCGSTDGLLSDNNDFYFVTDTLTVPKISTSHITASGNISASGIVYSNELNIQGTGRIYSPAPNNSLIIDGTGDSNITFNDSEADTDILIRGNENGWHFFKADAATENVGIGGDWQTSVPGQELTVQGNISGSGTGSLGYLMLPNIPISDPGVVGAVWKDGTDLKISEG